MQIAVMGAGAVGCWHGGMLARGGHEVTLIGRAPHVQAMQRDGLLLDTTRFRARVALHASTEAAAVRGAQLVLVCVKATDTEAAGAQMAPHLAPGASIISLQNGVDNAPRLQALLQREVLPAAVYVAAEMAGPGHVKHHGRGELVIGPAAASDAIAAMFRAAGVPVEVSADVLGALWAKLILNCAWNALSAITQQSYGDLVRSVATRDGVQALQRDVMNECLAVARAEGVTLPGDEAAPWQAIESLAQAMPNQRSSTAQDLARRRSTEIDHLNGHVLRRGAAHGIPTPANRALHTLVRLIEGGPTIAE